MALAETKPKRRWFRRRETGAKQSDGGISMSGGFVAGLESTWPLQFQPAYGAQVVEAHAGDYGYLWRSQPAVRTVINFLAENVAPLNVRVYRKSPTGYPTELPDHPAALLLQNPNPDLTRFDLLHGTMSALLTYENAFWWLLDSPDGLSKQIRLLPPEIVRVEGSAWIGPSRYIIRPNRIAGTSVPFVGNDQQFVLTPDQVVHFKSWNPQDMRIGISRLEGLRSILADDALAAVARAATWRNAAYIQNVVERPLDAPELRDDALKRHREDWQNQFGGARNAGKTVFAEEGEQMNWGPERRPWDTEYVAGRKYTLEEVARAFHIPLSMVGLIVGGGSKAASEERRTLYADVLDSKLVMIEEQLRGTFLRWFDDVENVYFKFNLKQKLRGSFQEEGALLTQAAGGPWMTRGEVRALQELPPLPGDDELIVPMNVTVGGQPNPLTPTETPAGPLYAGSAAPVLPETVDPTREAVRKHEDVLKAFFARQRNAVLGKLELKAENIFDQDRWDKELRLDLFPLALQTAGKAVGGLEDDVRTVAEGINLMTKGLLEAVGDDSDAVRGVFDVVLPERVAEMAQTLVASLATEEVGA